MEFISVHKMAENTYSVKDQHILSLLTRISQNLVLSQKLNVQTEYAKSGRAKCKDVKCKKKIEKEELRIVSQIISNFAVVYEKNIFI